MVSLLAILGVLIGGALKMENRMATVEAQHIIQQQTELNRVIIEMLTQK